jgi:hypothetical protein
VLVGQKSMGKIHPGHWQFFDALKRTARAEYCFGKLTAPAVVDMADTKGMCDSNQLDPDNEWLLQG